jgi:hypothetical protein
VEQEKDAALIRELGDIYAGVARKEITQESANELKAHAYKKYEARKSEKEAA